MKLIVTLAAAIAFAITIGVATADPVPRSSPAPAHVVPAEHVRSHASMTEQMRSMGWHTGHMGDDRWGAMRDPAHIAAEEEYQAQLDRMLAR